MTISYENNAAFRGYMPLGVENTEGKIDQREQVEYAAEYKDSHQHKTGEISFYHRLRSTNPWPDAVQPSLRPAIMEYVRSVLHIAEQLRESMCLAMNINPQEVDHLFGPCDGTDPSFWSLKLVSYPPVDSHVATASGEALQGVGAHTDSNFMTLICQDSRSSGLQVQNVHGGWIDVPPTEPNILVCNIGELSEIWSNGYFLATREPFINCSKMNLVVSHLLTCPIRPLQLIEFFATLQTHTVGHRFLSFTIQDLILS